MIDKNIFNTLNIEGKNTLRSSTQHKVTEDTLSDLPSSERSNFIINTNLDNENIIK